MEIAGITNCDSKHNYPQMFDLLSYNRRSVTSNFLMAKCKIYLENGQYCVQR